MMEAEEFGGARGWPDLPADLAPSLTAEAALTSSACKGTVVVHGLLISVQ